MFYTPEGTVRLPLVKLLSITIVLATDSNPVLSHYIGSSWRLTAIQCSLIISELNVLFTRQSWTSAVLAKYLYCALMTWGLSSFYV